MILTYKILNTGSSSNGGWSRKQLELLGVQWPLKQGWKAKIIGLDFSDATISEFLALRNSHLPHAKPIQESMFEVERKPTIIRRERIIPSAAFRLECPFDLPDDNVYLKRGWRYAK